MKRSVSTLTPPPPHQRPQRIPLYEYTLERAPPDRTHHHHHRCHRRKEKKQKSLERSSTQLAAEDTAHANELMPMVHPGEVSSRERKHERGRSQERKHHSSSEKQRFYSCDRYGSRDHSQPKSGDHSRTTSPNGGQEHGHNRQGSGSVNRSPLLSTSGASTPCRGVRRQLPQTPLTPRPSVTYKTANSSPVHFSHFQTGIPNFSPGRLSRGLSEHNALLHSETQGQACFAGTRTGSDPYLGRREEFDSFSRTVPEDALTFEEALATSSGRSSRTSYVSSMTSQPSHVRRVPNGCHYTLGLNTGPGTGGRGRSYYQEDSHDDWC